MTVKLLTGHHLEFLSLNGSCTGLSESTMAKIPHCWKSHVMAQMFAYLNLYSCLLIGLSFIYSVSIKESSVARLGSVCRRVYRIFAIISIMSSNWSFIYLQGQYKRIFSS